MNVMNIRNFVHIGLRNRARPDRDWKRTGPIFLSSNHWWNYSIDNLWTARTPGTADRQILLVRRGLLRQRSKAAFRAKQTVNPEQSEIPDNYQSVSSLPLNLWPGPGRVALVKHIKNKGNMNSILFSWFETLWMFTTVNAKTFKLDVVDTIGIL